MTHSAILLRIKDVAIISVRTMVGEFFEKLVVASSGKKLKSNVLSSLTWLGAIVIPSCLLGLMNLYDLPVRVFCALLLLGYIVYYIRQYEYWKKKDPDRLQSEWAMLEMKALMESKKDAPRLIERGEVVNPPKQIMGGGDSE